jgi:hypothetical protein
VTAMFEVAVLGGARESTALAGAAGSLLAAGAAARSAVVLVAGSLGGAATPAPATPAARRLGARLQARDLSARAAGRVVWCTIDAAGAARRAAGTGAPVVLAVCAARPAWVEPLLEEAGVALVAGAVEDPVTLLAIAGLERRGIRAEPVAAPLGIGAVLGRLGAPAPASWAPALARLIGATA